MALFVIADTHLSELTEKPMDVFGHRWNNWTARLCENWHNTVRENDTVIIPGDISWAMTLEEAKADLKLLAELPGKKIIGKGNHDYWWCTLRKNEEFLKNEGIEGIEHLYNNSFLIEDKVICGCRGWYNDEKVSPRNADYEKIVAREAGRLKRSLESAKIYPEDKERIVFFHFPPIFGSFVCDELVNILNDYGVKRCYYGHIHGKYDVPQTSEYNGITFTLISADYLDFRPHLIN